jgi:hypothetical protein
VQTLAGTTKQYKMMLIPMEALVGTTKTTKNERKFNEITDRHDEHNNK